MKHAPIFLLLLALSGTSHLAAGDLLPGAIYTQTARDGTTISAGDKNTQTKALHPGTIFAAEGQTVSAPPGLAVALVLSNGHALYLPNGGRLTLEEFTQEAVTNTGQNREYEPTRSNLHLNLAEGTLVISGRNPEPTSTFILTTPLAQISSQARSMVVQATADSVTITVMDGIAEITTQEIALHDTVQAGQTATISRKNLHDAYPLKLIATGTDASEHLGVLLDSARRIESYTTFTGPHQHFQVTLDIPVDHTLQVSADDPRFL